MIITQFQGGGACSICELPTIIVATDLPTELKVGRCCLSELRFADAILSQAPGYCHPDPTIPPNF